MLGAYRRFYLYSALSVSLIAAAVAAAAVLALGFRAVGLGAEPLTVEDVRLTLSQTAALLVFAIPIGYVHLRLIRSGLGDPAERLAGVRHFYLNLWICVSLIVTAFAGMNLFMVMFIVFRVGADRSIPLAAAIVPVGVAVLGWRWLRTTPGSPVWGIRMAVAALVIVAGLVAMQVNIGAAAAGQLVTGQGLGSASDVSPAARAEGELRWSVASAPFLLLVWAVAARWLWPHRTASPRLGYLVIFYAIGVIALSMGVMAQISGFDAWIRGRDFPRLAAGWPALAMGLVFVVLHGGGLLLDRGHNGHPRVAVERGLVGIPSLVGLAALVGSLVFLWTTAVDFWLLPGHYSGDARDRVGNALGPLIVGVVLYPATWWTLLRRSDAGSAVRRFVVFTVICVALVATVVSGAVAVFNLFSLATGAERWMDHQYDLALWSVPAVLFAAVFVVYFFFYLRDQRAQRAMAPAVVAPPPDPLVELLEEVAAHHIAPSEAAKRARALAHAH